MHLTNTYITARTPALTLGLPLLIEDSETVQQCTTAAKYYNPILMLLVKSRLPVSLYLYAINSIKARRYSTLGTLKKRSRTPKYIMYTLIRELL